jgi:hypothetical protein
MAIEDPTSDLHWDDFKGPIHEFFDRNVQAHPDRVCVIGMTPFRVRIYCKTKIANLVNRNCFW